ncbi:SMAD/FHA domain-containing protein [Irpex rosettiformis]|uniref:SMAD/FHA domain-containing protein n=1 Tax=Irpex rosettiformis TaxID=378272 RepID=A0ACB8U0V7_9APHY|nr:SMAD/FHA domain-containing protein [Irpex rosettiformis]
MARNSPSPSRDGYRDNSQRKRQREDYSDRDEPRRGHSDRDGDSSSRYSRRREDEPYRTSRRDDREREYGSSRNGDRRYRERDGDRDKGRDMYRGDRRRDDRYRDREREREGDRDKPSTSRRSASPPPQRSRSQSDRPSRQSPAPSKSAEPEDKAKPNFANSGLLAAATKTVKHADGTGTVLKYHEPPEARKPVVGWRLYVFKGKEQTDLLHIHRQSAYLIGRDKLVADITIDHPSCSKQHAVIQFRQIHEKNEFGETKIAVKPFIIDLESTNGTKVNDEPVPTSRYFELKLGDVIKFGDSVREYVLLSEDAA